MQLLPAIDLQNGQCVRLKQGRFDSTTVYDRDPLAVARRYRGGGAQWLHLVDLDAAEGSGRNNRSVVEQLAADGGLSLQVGGGLRDARQLDELFACGVARIVIGSLAVRAPDTVRRWLAQYGAERIVLALDVRIEDGTPTVMTHGWQSDSGVSLWQALTGYGNAGLKHVLCTDIARDGMGLGPNLGLYGEMCTRFPDIAVQASGGVTSAADLRGLKETGVAAAISGRALLAGDLTLADAFAEAAAC